MSRDDSTEHSEDEVRTAVGANIREDAERGELGSLAHYLSEHPNQEEAVAASWLSSCSALPRPDPNRDSGPTIERVGAYRIEEELGRGGQGVVYLARDERLRRNVALKVLTGLGPGAELQLARFRREAEVASRLDHPGICGVYETGIEDGIPFIAMRFVEGESLADRIAKVGADPSTNNDTYVSLGTVMEPPTETPQKTSVSSGATTVMSRADLNAILRLFEKTARALHVAHESGIIHRDIKPGNIMIDRNEQPVILDFGLARDESDDSAATLTRSGEHFGTPAYMSPEQISGSLGALDRRSDIFSLGVSLFEALTLVRPFTAPTRDALYQAILKDEPADPRRINRRIPQDLKAVIECALEKDRDARYATAVSFAEDLAAIRESRPIAARRIGAMGRALRWAKRHPVRATLAAVLILGIPLVAGLGGYLFANFDDIQAQEAARLAESVEAEVEEGFLCIAHGKPEQALDRFEAAMKLAPEDPEALFGRVMTLVRLGRATEALAQLEEAEGSPVEPDLLAPVRADILSVMGREDEAEAIRSELPPPHSALAWFIAGSSRFGLSENPTTSPTERRALQKEAEDMLRRAVMSSRPRRAYHYMLASVVGRLGRESRCRAVADALTALWPDRAETWFTVGFVEMAVNPKRSEAAYRKAIELDPRIAQAHQNLGMLLGARGDSEGALASFRKANAIEPSARTYHNIANTLRRNKRYEEAIVEAKKAIELGSTIPELHAGMAQSLGALGRTEESRAAYREAIRLRPGFPAAHINLGVSLSKEGKYDEAIANYRQALIEAPDFAPIHYVLGNALRAKKDTDEAARAYRETIRCDARHLKAHRRLTALLAMANRHDEAIPAYRKALLAFPEDADFHCGLGESLALSGQPEQAAASLREATRLQPDHALAHCRLGLTLSRLKQQPKAFEALKRGHELGQNLDGWPHPSGRWLTGVGLYLARDLEKKEGDPKAALEVIEQIIPIMPNLAPLQAEKKRLAAILERASKGRD